MNYYFLPLLPASTNLRSELSLLDCASNRRKSFFKNASTKYELYQMGINKWHKVDEITHQKNISFLSIKSENYSSNQNSDLVVVVPVNEFSSLNECTTLPLPSSNKKALTPYADRALLTFKSSITNGRGSYASEYPCEMSKRLTTLLTSGILFSSLKSRKFVLFINILRTPLQFDGLITLIDNDSFKNIDSFIIKPNSINLIDFSNIENINNINICSNNISSIPVFIECFIDGNISVEHTHPPSEFFISSNRFKHSSILKSNWLNAL